jgi:hypothetical protein
MSACAVGMSHTCKGCRQPGPTTAGTSVATPAHKSTYRLSQHLCTAARINLSVLMSHLSSLLASSSTSSTVPGAAGRATASQKLCSHTAFVHCATLSLHLLAVSLPVPQPLSQMPRHRYSTSPQQLPALTCHLCLPAVPPPALCLALQAVPLPARSSAPTLLNAAHAHALRRHT